jgi:hypothetical protein
MCVSSASILFLKIRSRMEGVCKDEALRPYQLFPELTWSLGEYHMEPIHLSFIEQVIASGHFCNYAAPMS